MNVIENLFSVEEASKTYPDFEQQTLTLGWEERRKIHGKRTSDQGMTFAFSLPIGTRLESGKCFVIVEEQMVISVVEASEEVVVLTPQTPQEFAYFAYQIGNRHQALMIAETELICLAEHAVLHLLRQMKIDYTTAKRPFQGVFHVSGHTH